MAMSKAASRKIALISSERSHSLVNATDITPPSWSPTWSPDQEKRGRSWTHSKEPSITPPLVQRMSGTTVIPRSLRNWSASGVVGPFAPSLLNDVARTVERLRCRNVPFDRGRDQEVAWTCQDLVRPDWARQPGNPATRQPGNPATRQPGNPATRHLTLDAERDLPVR